MTRVAIVKLSQELLIKALGLPPDAVIEAARINTDRAGREIELRIKHEGLLIVSDGQSLPWALPCVEGGSYPTFKKWIQ